MKLSDIKYLFYKSNRRQLLTVNSMIFNISLGLAQLILSSIELSLFLGFSGFYNIIIALGKFFALERLLRIKTIDEKTKNNAEMKSIDRINYCTLILSVIFFCFGVVIVFFYEDPTNYSLGMLIFIIASAIIKFFIFIANIFIAIRKKTGIQHYIKLMNAASFIISLALLQRAILYYIAVPYTSIYSGIGGIFFSLLASLIGVLMVRKARQEKELLLELDLLDNCYKIENSKVRKLINIFLSFFRKIICFLKPKKEMQEKESHSE